MDKPHFDPMEMGNPFPFYAHARKETPVFYDAKAQAWVLCKYADVRAALSDDQGLSAEAERESYAGLCIDAVRVLEPISFHELFGLSSTENPEHDQVKATALPLFNELYLSRLKPRLGALAEEYLHGIAGYKEFDLVTEVCGPYPAAAICLLLGIPRRDLPLVKEWSASRLALTWGSPDEQIGHARNVVRYWEYCNELVDRKMVEPDDDLPSMLASEVKAGKLSVHQLKLLCYGLMFSGHATTSAFLAESLYQLLARGVWKLMALSQTPVEPTVHEMLRLFPSAFTRRRLVLKDTTIRGHLIPKGSTVLLVIGSANRDEDVFVASDELRLDRPNAKQHLSFGYGFHHCIGAKLVQLKYAALVGHMLKRFSNLRLIGRVPRYNRNLSIRTPDQVLVAAQE